MFISKGKRKRCYRNSPFPNGIAIASRYVGKTLLITADPIVGPPPRIGSLFYLTTVIAPPKRGPADLWQILLKCRKGDIHIEKMRCLIGTFPAERPLDEGENSFNHQSRRLFELILRKIADTTEIKRHRHSSHPMIEPLNSSAYRSAVGEIAGEIGTEVDTRDDKIRTRTKRRVKVEGHRIGRRSGHRKTTLATLTDAERLVERYRVPAPAPLMKRRCDSMWDGMPRQLSFKCGNPRRRDAVIIGE